MREKPISRGIFVFEPFSALSVLPGLLSFVPRRFVISRSEVQILSSALLLRLSCCLRFHRVPRSELLAETAVACQGGGVAPSTRENKDWVF